MKKFIIKIISYGIVLAMLVVGVNAIYVNMNKQDEYHTDKFSSMPTEIKVCNVGSSHGLYGFNYSDYNEDVNCFNFGLSSQYLTYDYRLLYYYQDNLDEGCTIFIPISYFSFCGQKEELSEDFESKNKRYYKILPRELIKQYDIATAFSMAMPALSVDRMELVRTLFGRTLDNSEPEFWDQTADEIDLAYDVECAYLRHLVTNKIDDSGQYIILQENYEAVYDIINLCKTKGWRPVLITTPFLEEYTNLAWNESSDYMEIHYELINRIVEKTGVEYYDYSLDERFSNRHDLFMNGDHLNREGAEKFTKIVFEEILGY